MSVNTDMFLLSTTLTTVALASAEPKSAAQPVAGLVLPPFV